MRLKIGSNRRGVGRSGLLAATIVVLVLTIVQSASAWSPGDPQGMSSVLGGSDCAVLPESQYPIDYAVDFDADIRPTIESGFVQGGCNDCHVVGTSGGMSLAVGNVRASLLGPVESGAPAAGDPSRLRVKPFSPTESMLFLKVNCGAPPFGSQMPPGGQAAGQFRSALHDWIAGGALMPGAAGGDRTFVGTFETISRPGTTQAANSEAHRQ